MRKMMKKQVAGFVAGAMLLTLGGCMPTGSTAGTQAQKTETSTEAGKQGGNDAKASAETTGAETSQLEVNTTDPIEIRFNWWGGDARHEATLAAIKKFEAKYPNITVKAEYEAFNGHEEKVALSIKSGSAADVMQLDWGWVFDYSPNGDNFYDLNKVSNIIDLSNYTDADKELFTVNGHLEALPISKTGRVFYWNKDTFEKVGVAYPTTLDELVAAGKAFESYDKNCYPLITKELDRAFLMTYYLECKYGKDWVKDGRLQYTEEEIADGFDFLKMLEDNHVMPTLEKVAGDGADLIDTNSNWINGNYAGIFLYDTSVVKHAQAVTNGTCELGEFIRMGDYQGGVTKVTQALAISAASEHPAEAAALIQFLMAEEEGVVALGDTRGIPANAAGLSYLDLSGSDVAKANAKVLEWAQYQLDPTFERASFTGEDGSFFMALQMASYGQQTSAEAAKDVVAGVNKELQK